MYVTDDDERGVRPWLTPRLPRIRSRPLARMSGSWTSCTRATWWTGIRSTGPGGISSRPTDPTPDMATEAPPRRRRSAMAPRQPPPPPLPRLPLPPPLLRLHLLPRPLLRLHLLPRPLLLRLHLLPRPLLPRLHLLPRPLLPRFGPSNGHRSGPRRPPRAPLPAMPCTRWPLGPPTNRRSRPSGVPALGLSPIWQVR